jgi:hypothetical protein
LAGYAAYLILMMGVVGQTATDFEVAVNVVALFVINRESISKGCPIGS